MSLRSIVRPNPIGYLTHVAVAPEAQGHGVGSKLMRHRLSEIDGEGSAAYLEATTPGSQQLYERFGFVVEASLGMTPTGHPMSMSRPPTPGAD
ncbi:MAG: GNAT family N-acetyltransferase [Propionibacteriaceae bacterium]|nr:GNAT family N-acetyltransferase [Propionibacteriaceae bacterium]